MIAHCFSYAVPEALRARWPGDLYVSLHGLLSDVFGRFMPVARAQQLAVVFVGAIPAGIALLWYCRIYRPLRKAQKAENEAFVRKLEAEQRNESNH